MKAKEEIRLCFLHGLDSSPQGTKASLLRSYDPSIRIPPLPPYISESLAILERELRQPVVLVGSSWGGLIALVYAMRHPDMVRGLVLLAPAVGTEIKGLFTEDQKRLMDSVFVPKGIPTAVIAGRRDEVIPLLAIRALINRSPDPDRVQLHEMDDDHDLHQSLDFMIEVIEQMRRKLE